MDAGQKLNLDFQIIFGAANSSALPSSSMPTRDRAEKSFSIAAWAQEMSLAGLLRAKELGLSVNPDLLASSENVLMEIYAAAGIENPAAAVCAAKQIIVGRMTTTQEPQGRSML